MLYTYWTPQLLEVCYDLLTWKYVECCCRPIPGREYVETYVKAYYLPEAQLESWIADHKVSFFVSRIYYFFNIIIITSNYVGCLQLLFFIIIIINIIIIVIITDCHYYCYCSIIIINIITIKLVV